MAAARTPKTHQVGQAGEHLVAGELHRRGAYAVTFAGNMPKIDILASDQAQWRTVSIQVKTKTGRDWQGSIKQAENRSEDPDETRFWVLVDIGKDPSKPAEFFVIPEWWIVRYIYRTHREFLARHGGKRPRSPGSTHTAIRYRDMKEWRDRWDVLGIFD